MDIKTTNIYLSAYLLTKKINFKDIINYTNTNSKKKVMFVFPGGAAIQDMVNAFNSGNAVANVAELRNQLEVVRDLMFSELRTSN